jgi:hypothetical protein
MAQLYRERDIRYTRERSRSSSGDERHYKTVSHYKVGGGAAHLERVERYEEDDDRRSRYSHSHLGRPGADIVEVDRRVEKTVYPDRPRSALDAPSRGSDSYRGDSDRYRTVEYEREVERDRDYYAPERHSRTRVVEETRDVVSPTRDHYWDRRRPWDDTDLRLEKRVVSRDSDGDVKVKEKSLDIHRDKHHHNHHHDDGEIERYRREVEYYSAPDPPQQQQQQQPIIIRQKMPDQKVIVHEAPAPAPVIVPRADPAFIVLREGNRDSRRDDDYHRRHDDERYGGYTHDEDYYIKKTVIRRDRSSSSDHHKKRHIAEGALAGAGLGALVGSRRGKDGEYEDHKGRKVLAGAALGALGTEVLRRARSAYDDRHDEYEYDDDSRYRHRSKSRSRLATGLAIGAAALAVAGGLKYMQSQKIDQEESHRGRRRRRHSTDDYSLSRSGSRRSSHRGRSRSKSNVAKAGAATA